MRPANGFLPDSSARCKLCFRFIVWMKASWERGRPARTMPDTASAISQDRPETAPRLSFGLAVAVPADVVATCKVALMLSDPQLGQDAGGTPALPGDAPPLEGESQKSSRKAKADAVGGTGPAPGIDIFHYEHR